MVVQVPITFAEHSRLHPGQASTQGQKDTPLQTAQVYGGVGSSGIGGQSSTVQQQSSLWQAGPSESGRHRPGRSRVAPQQTSPAGQPSSVVQQPLGRGLRVQRASGSGHSVAHGHTDSPTQCAPRAQSPSTQHCPAGGGDLQAPIAPQSSDCQHSPSAGGTSQMPTPACTCPTQTSPSVQPPSRPRHLHLVQVPARDGASQEAASQAQPWAPSHTTHGGQSSSVQHPGGALRGRRTPGERTGLRATNRPSSGTSSLLSHLSLAGPTASGMGWPLRPQRASSWNPGSTRHA